MAHREFEPLGDDARLREGPGGNNSDTLGASSDSSSCSGSGGIARSAFAQFGLLSADGKPFQVRHEAGRPCEQARELSVQIRGKPSRAGRSFLFESFQDQRLYRGELSGHVYRGLVRDEATPRARRNLEVRKVDQPCQARIALRASEMANQLKRIANADLPATRSFASFREARSGDGFSFQAKASSFRT